MHRNVVQRKIALRMKNKFRTYSTYSTYQYSELRYIQMCIHEQRRQDMSHKNPCIDNLATTPPHTPKWRLVLYTHWLLMQLTLSDLQADRGSTGQRLSCCDSLLSAGIFLLCFWMDRFCHFHKFLLKKNAEVIDVYIYLASSHYYYIIPCHYLHCINNIF